MNRLDDALNLLGNVASPVSIFVYGSRARSDFLETSDYELGLLLPETNYIEGSIIRNALKEAGLQGINAYPFELEDFIAGKIDTPFQTSIFFRELASGGAKTLRGKRIVEELKPPTIKALDLVQRIRFDIGIALAAAFSFRNNDLQTTSLEFTKSCLFGTRCLVILQLKKFALSYDDIFNASKKLELKDYKKIVIEKAYKVRKRLAELEEEDIYKNISFLNEFVEEEIIKYFEKEGNRILIK